MQGGEIEVLSYMCHFLIQFHYSIVLRKSQEKKPIIGFDGEGF